jgi:hypothetical protein
MVSRYYCIPPYIILVFHPPKKRCIEVLLYIFMFYFPDKILHLSHKKYMRTFLEPWSHSYISLRILVLRNPYTCKNPKLQDNKQCSLFSQSAL